MKKIKIKKLNSKIVVLTVITIAVVCGGVYYFVQARTADQTSDSSSDQAAEEKQARDDFKANLPAADKDQNKEKSAGSSSGVKTVKPQITSSGQYDSNVEVGARVPGIFEKSGGCTLTLSKDGVNVSVSQNATPNVSEMSCGFMTIKRSRLSAGTWQAKVTYSSDKAKGESDITQIEVN